MSRTIVKLRVVKTVTRSLGSGIRESFWTLQKKGIFRWKDVGIFGTSDDAMAHAHKMLSV